ncbi:MAG: META domain-containing protein [Chloroflexi bacterium]|nr:META domain-containing protein [Chloroflexota bacterium]
MTANGGPQVAGLPQPAATLANDSGRSLEWTAYHGPLLTESLILQASSGDGNRDDLELLSKLAQASVAQGAATAATIDPVCAAVLGTTAVSSERFEPVSFRTDGLTDLVCGYDLGNGSVVELALRWSDPAFLPNCCVKVKGLGAGAWAQQSGSGKKAPWRIDWIAEKGDPTRTATLNNSPAAAKPLGKAGLIALAGAVTSDATPASAPTAEPTIGPGTSISGALVGDWILSGVDGPPVTASFARDGTFAFTVACATPKGKQAPAPNFQSTYTVDGDQVDVAPSSTTAGCKKEADQTFVRSVGFGLGMATHPGTWAVAGDTLTITDPGAPITITITFTRAPDP